MSKVASVKRRMREYSITGWHRDDCPHVTIDMCEPYSQQCLSDRALIEDAEGPWLSVVDRNGKKARGE